MEKRAEAMPGNLGGARRASGHTQAQVSEMTGIPLSTLRRWEQGVNEPDMGSLLKLADLYGISLDSLFSAGLELSGLEKIGTRPATRKIPVLGRIAAGTPREAIAQSDESWWLLDPTKLERPRLFYLSVAGDSMDKMFADGTLLLVDPDEQIRSGDVAVIFVNGDDATVKRVFFAGDTVVLHPESTNPEHRDRSIDRSDPDAPEVRIVGKVVGYTSPEGWRA